jgi:hypothetical protein
MNLSVPTKIAAALCLAGAALFAADGFAQSTQGSTQRVLIDPSKYIDASNPPPSGYVTDDGTLIAPADLGGRLPQQTQAPAKDGILRSAPPATAVDADGHRAVVSGATIH